VSAHETRSLDLPTRIAVVGDTHLGQRRDWLPVELLDGLARADLILHTGDFSTVAARDLFRRVKPVLAVRGNNDEDELAGELPACLTLLAGNRTIKVTHGHLAPGLSAKEAVIRAYAGKADLVIFGHSHRVYDEEVEGTRFLNPGSPTAKRWEPRFSYALLDIDQDGTFHIQIVYFDKQTRPLAG
jgi:uncharacterized protein